MSSGASARRAEAPEHHGSTKRLDETLKRCMWGAPIGSSRCAPMLPPDSKVSNTTLGLILPERGTHPRLGATTTTEPGIEGTAT